MRAPPSNVSWRGYRLAVTSRVLAAAAGGYVLASACAAAGAIWWPGPSVDGVMAASMLAFVVFVCAAIWAFTARTAWRAWWPIMLAAVSLAGLWGLKRWLLS